MTFTLTPNTEALLHTVAAQSGLAPEEALISLLNQALAVGETELLAEFRASVADHAAGRSMTIEEYREKALVKRQERDTHQDTPTTELAA